MQSHVSIFVEKMHLLFNLSLLFRLVGHLQGHNLTTEEGPEGCLLRVLIIANYKTRPLRRGSIIQPFAVHECVLAGCIVCSWTVTTITPAFNIL